MLDPRPLACASLADLEMRVLVVATPLALAAAGNAVLTWYADATCTAPAGSSMTVVVAPGEQRWDPTKQRFDAQTPRSTDAAQCWAARQQIASCVRRWLAAAALARCGGTSSLRRRGSSDSEATVVSQQCSPAWLEGQ